MNEFIKQFIVLTVFFGVGVLIFPSMENNCPPDYKNYVEGLNGGCFNEDGEAFVFDELVHEVGWVQIIMFFVLLFGGCIFILYVVWKIEPEDK